MLDLIKFTPLTKPEIDLLFSDFDLDNTSTISFSQFISVYDESTIHNLFPSLIEFKSQLTKNLKLKKTNIKTILKNYESSPNSNFINKNGFNQLMSDFGLIESQNKNPLTPRDKDFLFNYFDIDGSGRISYEEIRVRILGNKWIDIVHLINKIRNTCKQRGWDMAQMFQQAGVNGGRELSFWDLFVFMGKFNIN
jgi:Ca2+-binding EF-hand superfamily protein